MYSYLDGTFAVIGHNIGILVLDLLLIPLLSFDLQALRLLLHHEELIKAGLKACMSSLAHRCTALCIPERAEGSL